MICLDTNYLILGLVKDSLESERIVGWATAGEALVAPMPVWYEFLCGPVSEAQVAVMRAFLAEIIPFVNGMLPNQQSFLSLLSESVV